MVSKLEIQFDFFGVNILGHDSKWVLVEKVADYEYTDKNRRLLSFAPTSLKGGHRKSLCGGSECGRHRLKIIPSFGSTGKLVERW